MLYALRRLSMIFRMTLKEMEGGKELIELSQDCQNRSNRFCQVLSQITPMSGCVNPLQIVLDDVSCAKSVLEGMSMPNDQVYIAPLSEHSTVADYVNFIAKFDEMSRRVDHLRVTTSLGVTPP